MKGSACKPEEELDAKQTVIYQAISAISDFAAKKFADPLVGDQLCEIRAYQLITLSRIDLTEELSTATAACQAAIAAIEQTRFDLKSLQEEEAAILAEKRKALEPFKLKNAELNRQLAEQRKTAQNSKELVKKFQQEFALIKKESESINEEIVQIRKAYLSKQFQIVAERTIDVPVSQKILLIVQAYLLTKIKLEQIVWLSSEKVIISDKTLVSKLRVEGINCPTAIFEKTIPLLKKSVVTSSIAFLQQHKEAALRRISTKKQDEVPFYYALKIVYQKALMDKIPVILKIREQSVSPHNAKAFVCRQLFRVEGAGYVPAQGDFEDDSPALVVEAYSTQKKKVLKTAAFLNNLLEKSGGLFNYLVELDAVQHTQYTDQLETDECIFDLIPGITEEDKTKLVNQRQEAIAKGFGSISPTICCVEHVFADIISNQFRGVV